MSAWKIAEQEAPCGLDGACTVAGASSFKGQEVVHSTDVRQVPITKSQSFIWIHPMLSNPNIQMNVPTSLTFNLL